MYLENNSVIILLDVWEKETSQATLTFGHRTNFTLNLEKSFFSKAGLLKIFQRVSSIINNVVQFFQRHPMLWESMPSFVINS